MITILPPLLPLKIFWPQMNARLIQSPGGAAIPNKVGKCPRLCIIFEKMYSLFNYKPVFFSFTMHLLSKAVSNSTETLCQAELSKEKSFSFRSIQEAAELNSLGFF